LKGASLAPLLATYDPIILTVLTISCTTIAGFSFDFWLYFTINRVQG
jgi:hypothetical protein